jgi:hypothetical protein
VFSVIIFQIPLRNVEFISVIKIKSVSFKIYRKQSLRININYVETWGFSFIGGNWTYYKVHQYWKLLDHISNNLVLFLVNMWVYSKSDYILISIKYCMKSSSILSHALVLVWNMGENHRCSSFLFKFIQFGLQPFKHVTWVLKLYNWIKIHFVTNIWVNS